MRKALQTFPRPWTGLPSEAPATAEEGFFISGGNVVSLNIKGYEVLLDDEDLERVQSKTWGPVNKSTQVYMVNNSRVPGMRSKNRQSHISLHRFILNVDDRKIVVDHKDGNTMNNQKSNLRLCTTKENSRNRRRVASNPSGYKGVFWHPKNKKWFSHICVDGKVIYLGTGHDPKALHELYCQAAVKYHGEFARFE